ncbi:hypothetical protein ZHAS_00021367 [Anopheles sinensis]|uniref:Uncharacterized protein n=1 Tax=Anopheles sinensis TaxID=74873 RepID=A0A084WS78_ANOSI|nr:hypothetical protein ZHAS_00021367 [Anopheles sinensis]
MSCVEADCRIGDKQFSPSAGKPRRAFEVAEIEKLLIPAGWSGNTKCLRTTLPHQRGELRLGATVEALRYTKL